MNIALASIMILAAPVFAAEIELKLQVKDDDGRAVQGADVWASFEGLGPHDKADEAVSVTDAHGCATLHGEPMDGLPFNKLMYRVKKPGYYVTIADSSDNESIKYEFPVLLRRKINPQPMFAKYVFSEIPKFGALCGYDFKVGDWVLPDGEGEKSDIYFMVEELTDQSGRPFGRLSITFEEGGGLKKIDLNSGFNAWSEMKLPHLAHEEGYDVSMQRSEYSIYHEKTEQNCGYYIRSRCGRVNGKKVCNYAKIIGDFEFAMGGMKYSPDAYDEKSPEPYARISFIYYFNPNPNDRNLEFDTNSNLMKPDKINCRNFDP